MPLIVEYAAQGVQTIASVAMQDYAGTFNHDRYRTLTMSIFHRYSTSI